MLGNAVEALVGAVYLEKGYDATKRFVINKILRSYLDIHKMELSDDNFKSQLLEWCQKNGKDISYEVLDRFKVDKRDRFKVAVLVDGNQLAQAEDFNKKSAEQSASQLALIKISQTNGQPPE
jgi:ribonuclease-3